MDRKDKLVSRLNDIINESADSLSVKELEEVLKFHSVALFDISIKKNKFEQYVFHSVAISYMLNLQLFLYHRTWRTEKKYNL